MLGKSVLQSMKNQCYTKWCQYQQNRCYVDGINQCYDGQIDVRLNECHNDWIIRVTQREVNINKIDIILKEQISVILYKSMLNGITVAIYIKSELHKVMLI